MFGSIQKNVDLRIVWRTIFDNTGVNLSNFISQGSNTDNNGIFSFLAALDFVAQEQSELTNQVSDLTVRNKIIKKLMDFEKLSGGKWRFVADFPVKDGVYQAPVIQFCNGSPKYDRFIIDFGGKPLFRLETDCVTSSFDLNTESLGGVSLGDAIKYYDGQNIQRIAILGLTRIFPYGKMVTDKQSSSPSSKEQFIASDKDIIEIEKAVEKFSEVAAPILRKNNGISDLQLESLEKHIRSLLLMQELRSKRMGGIFDEKIKELKGRIWAIRFTARAQDELDKFLTAMDEIGARYTTVNGGWAGIQEGSMGMTMISSLFGIVHSGEKGGVYPPITIMPHGGSYDRVKTALDHGIIDYLKNLVFDIIAKNVDHSNDEVFESSPIVVQQEQTRYTRALSPKFKEDLNGFLGDNLNNISDSSYGVFVEGLFDFVKSRNINPGIFTEEHGGIFGSVGYDALTKIVNSTCFEIPGVWGDDSKYLIAMSTALLVFEPYGFWSNIEIANGIAQGKPVAIVASENSLKEYGEYFETQEFVEINRGDGICRLYRSAAEAAKWFNDTLKPVVEMGNDLPSDFPKLTGAPSWVFMRKIKEEEAAAVESQQLNEFEKEKKVGIDEEEPSNSSIPISGP